MKQRKIRVGRDLTQGSIGRQLILFAIPFLGSSLIQQLYNTVDLIFVGKLLGKESAAAVGAGSLMITCILGFFTGMSVGVGVIAGKAFGSGNRDDADRSVHTAAGMAVLGGIVFMIVAELLAPTFLTLLNTPADIMDLAVTYIRIYFLALLPIVCFNISSGILRAMGDSRSPMMYQLAGGITNVFANAFFMMVLDMGVRGAAIATLCSQSMAAFLTVRHLCRMNTEYRLRFSKIRIDLQIAASILKIGIPAAIQSMVITLSNLIVQSQINSLGVVSIAAFTSYFKVENFIYLPILAFGQANANFSSQNIGAKKWERARKGTKTSLLLGVAVTVFMSILLLTFRKYAFGLFSVDADVIDLGSRIAGITFPFYFLYVFLEVFSSAMRGAGKSFPPMVMIVFNMCVVRLIALKIAMSVLHSAEGVAVIYPITWFGASVCLAGFYFLGNWKKE